MKNILVRQLGNMGDMLFLVPPALETLKKKYPDSLITLVTAWGYKEVKRRAPLFLKKARWGNRNQGGFAIALMMTNPHVDQLIHYHDTDLSLEGNICVEEGKHFPTWNRNYYEQQKRSGNFDAVYELDFGIGHTANPITSMYTDVLRMPQEMFSNYKVYFTDSDRKIAQDVMRDIPKPRIVLLEGLEGTTTRGWDPKKVSELEERIRKQYGVKPRWFGGKYIPEYNGRKLTLRENIATLTLCDVAIGVMSGPLHFAAAAGVPTITLYADQPLHRAAPSYFLNEYITDPRKHHRTILGPSRSQNITFLKDDAPFVNLTPQEAKAQEYVNWQNPGQQATKSVLSVITVDEVMTVLNDHLHGTR